MLQYLDVLLSAKSTIPEACEALRAITVRLSSHPDAACIVEKLFCPQDFLVRFKTNVGNEEFTLCALNCIDSALSVQHQCRDNINTKQLQACEAIGDILLQLLYQSRRSPDDVISTSSTKIGFVLSVLSILGKVSLVASTQYLQTHVSELLGVAKAHLNFGLFDSENNQFTHIKPVEPCHSLPADSSDEPEAENIKTQKARSASGGKISKKRKPRSVAKPSAQAPIQQCRLQTFDLENIVVDMKTSDSDASDVDAGQSYGQRHNRARVRKTAINLMSIIASRIKDRRVLYAYWYAFFENVERSVGRRCDLLNVALHDPNMHCRSLALQVSAQIIFHSKGFLQQAECIQQRCPSTFTHFAHDLGVNVLHILEELTQILSDSTNDVTQQALKCIAVLVQALTPFKRFQPRKFVSLFVKEVRRLINHRDSTIQVASLMVMEFLITSPELTPEITDAIGMPHIAQLSNEKRLNDEKATDLLEIDNSFEEILESDNDEETSRENSHNTSKVLQISEHDEAPNKCCDTKMSWLLQITLDNLSTGTTASISVRLECLQLLSAMAQHFHLLHSHLDLVAGCIENSLKDESIDLRLCATRAMDTIAHQIGRTLLETPSHKTHNFENESLQFWARLLPILVPQINSMSTTETPITLRVSICDVFSNIGVILFERQPFNLQMKLVGLLSGIANDPNLEVTLRIAAVRALAVYVSFPSMRENLVFVENLAESTLCLASDANLMVRVKALWALGNISDALLIQNNERVSDALLWRMIATTTDACGDNDKVRCNAVRALGNLLRLINNFEGPFDGQAKFQSAILKLNDCLRLAGSAKVKWNTCYAIGNLLQNLALFCENRNSYSMGSKFDWQSKLFLSLSNVIVHHNNFKVRINAALALTRVTERSCFGAHFAILCEALLAAIEQSQNLDNFYEYNHRDQLQEQLCLAVCHLLKLSLPDDFLIFRKHLEPRFEVVHNINVRVLNRMVPEKSKGILACTAHLEQQLRTEEVNYTNEQKNAIKSIIKAFDNQ